MRRWWKWTFVIIVVRAERVMGLITYDVTVFLFSYLQSWQDYVAVLKEQ